MKLTIVLGVLSLMIIPRKGSCGKLNLTDEVRKYILAYVGEGIQAFNLTGGLQVLKERPTVKATVNDITYDGDCKQPKNLTYPKCKDYYFWYIYRSIVTPFLLPLNLTVLYKGQTNQTSEVNLNNATFVMWNPENLTTPLDYGHNYSEKKCNFSFEVRLKGKFAYRVLKTKGDKPKEDALGIGLVADLNKELVKSDDLTATYNAGGVFQHTVIC
ncbi:uncharacterized protein LOC125941629 [Dermacentor silvarum]|uniref:uncharacterized protein LOC125941629 n=1 Tax=Dermacentor silvarum TaxID=543639 RepID=UPI00210184D7|nr:uncharacterized protein LOC125941629 [Dermacentor silvarum]